MVLPNLTTGQLSVILGDSAPMTDEDLRAMQLEYEALFGELQNTLVVHERSCVDSAQIRVLAAQQELREAMIILENCQYNRDRADIANPDIAIKANRMNTLAKAIHKETMHRRLAVLNKMIE